MSRLRKSQKHFLKDYFFLFLIGSSAFVLRWFSTWISYLKKGERVFLGISSLFNSKDIWVYWADILVGKSGSFLLVNQFGAGPLARFFVRPFYVWLGFFTRFLNLSVENIYLLSAYLLTLGLAGALFLFTAHFFKDKHLRYLTVGLVLFSGPIFPYFPMESVPFLSLVEPHFTLAQVSMVLVFHFSLCYSSLKSFKQKKKIAGAILLFGLILSLIHVFMNLVLIAVLLVWLIFSRLFRLEKKASPTPFLVACLSFLPMYFYSLRLTKNPLFTKIFIEQNLLPSPSPIVIFSYIAPLFILVPLSFRIFKSNSKTWFLLIWPIIQIALIYFPVPWQRRLTEGWWVGVLFLTAVSVFSLLERMSKEAYQIRFFWIFIFCTFLVVGNLGLVLGESLTLNYREEMIYASAKEAEAWDYLKPDCDLNKIILTDLPQGIYLPAKTGCRSYFGHVIQTPDFWKKDEEIKRIMAGEISSPDLEVFLEEREINYVFLSLKETTKAQLDKIKNLKLVFENSEFLIYERI